MTLVVLPIVIPLVAAVLALALRGAGHRVQAALALLASFAHLLAAWALLAAVRARGAVTVQLGDWPAPFGIALHADLLAALMVGLTAIVGAAGCVYSLAELDAQATRRGYVPLYQLLIMGVSGAFLTADLFNLFVCFEVMLLASFVLLALGDGRAQGRERMGGALHYVAINLLSSALFLVAVGLVYAVAHTLDMSQLSERLGAVAEREPFLVAAMAALLLVSFGIKAGLAPLFGWLPASYHTPPVAVSAVFAGLLTKVGVYALIRVLGGVFPALPELFGVILAAAGATMIIGVLGAVAQREIRRILSFHIISQIGYIVVGVGLLASPDEDVRLLGLSAAIFYMVHHILVKANLFLVGGVISHLSGGEALATLGGLSRRAPWLAALFAIPALSLAGVPPLSGFWAKLAVLKATVAGGYYALAAAALVAGLLTVLSMLKIWNAAFWRAAPVERCSDAGSESPEAAPRPPTGRLALVGRIAPAAALAALTIAIGLSPAWLFEIASEAARALLAGGATPPSLG
ncbi:MAG: Na+/H+ antiporter subunit D [Haliangiales bacterium]